MDPDSIPAALLSGLDSIPQSPGFLLRDMLGSLLTVYSSDLGLEHAWFSIPPPPRAPPLTGSHPEALLNPFSHNPASL